jgi:hypothetical protein
MKPGMLCLLLLLSGCWSSDDPPPVYEFALTWTCLSSEGCERTDEVARIDRMERVRIDCHFASTRDESFSADATRVLSEFLPPGCSWLYFLSLFGHELDRSRLCFVPGGFALDLEIPNQDPTTSSMWLVEGRDVNLL